MSIADVREGITAALQTALGGNVAVQSHRGSFASAEEVKRFATKPAAVLVAALRVARAEDIGGVAMLPVDWGVFVITKDVPGVPRDVGALGIVQAILMLAGDSDWGGQPVGPSSHLDARNLYTPTIDQLGIALWGIGFQQAVETPQVSDAQYASLNPFVTFHQDIDMAPADGVVDITETDTLPQ